jgi:two-component system chemotaxis sensor kinase CheA
VFGLVQLGNYTHKYEDFIGELRNKVIPVTTKSINILLQVLDDLKFLFKGTTDKLNDEFFDLEELTAKYSFTQDFGFVAEVSEDGTENKKAVEKSLDDDKMTVSMKILNDFMEESGELTVIRNSILKTAEKIEGKYRGDNDVELLNELLDGMYNATLNIQGKIIDMRQVSLKNTFRPSKRLIRDLSKKLDKEVEIFVVGEELDFDNTIAKLYSNTLIHILRNSLDHGLETKQNRIIVGKSPAGDLQINIKEIGEDIFMEIKDDGNGIDPEIIKNKAIEKGLYT